MDDLAALGIKIDVAQIREAISLLDQLAERGPKVEASVDKVGKASRSAASEMGLLKTAAVSLFGAFSAKMLADISSEFSDLRGRVVDATGSLEKGAAVMDRLAEIARNTYSGLGQTAEGYLSNASAMRELGYSTRQVLDYTSALNNAMVISGAKAERATQVQNALSKAMALGKLNGENLNTVIQNGGEVATLLAKHFNTTTGGLLQLGAKGKITGDILANVLIKNMEQLEERAGKLPATINDGFTQIGSAITLLVGKWDELTGAGETFANGLLFIADNLETIAIVGTAVGVAFAGVYVKSLIAARAATLGLTASAYVLRTALLATGIGALAVGVGLLIDQFLKLSQRVGGIGKLFSLMGDVGKEVFERIILSGQQAGAGLSAIWAQIQQGFLQMLAAMTEKWADFLHNLASSMTNIPGMGGASDSVRGLAIDAGSSFYALTAAAEEAGNQVTALKGEYNEFGTAISAPLQSVQALRDAMNANGEEAVNLDDKLKRLNVAANDNDKAAKRLKKAWDDLLRTAKDRVAQMELEAQLVGKNAIEADVLRMKLEALQEAEKKGLTLKPEQIAQLDALADKYGQLATKVAEYQLMEEAAFDRQQMFRSPIDQRIASDLKQAGIEMDSAGGQAYATFVRTTEQIGLAKDAVRDFAGTFVSDILQGKSALEALTNALSRLADKLINMALDGAINSLFSGIMGSLGGGLLGGASSDPWSGLRLAEGGYVSGPGTGTSDSIMAMLSNGEFVMNAEATKLYGPLLAAMNDNKLPAFKDGGGLGDAGNIIPMPTAATVQSMAASPQAAQSSSSQNVKVTSDVRVSVDNNGNLLAFVRKQAAEVSESQITGYDRELLPRRFRQIAQDPYAVG
ncbi:tape measure protein [Brucella pituitosa]|uniref:tape measure protein n=1 Tax=Brucella pituitosa TaxID=571256 RepID=UPI003F4A9A26